MKNKELINLILKAISLAMGIGVVVLSVLDELDINNAIMILGIGLSCISILLLGINKNS